MFTMIKPSIALQPHSDDMLRWISLVGHWPANLPWCFCDSLMSKFGMEVQQHQCHCIGHIFCCRCPRH